MFLILAVCSHRLLQLASAKDDLTFYTSLSNYRNAANKRTVSFRETLKRTKRWAVDSRLQLARERVPLASGMMAASRASEQGKENARKTRAKAKKTERRPEVVAQQTFMTPSKNPRQKRSGTETAEEAEVIQFNVEVCDQTCTGIPYFIDEELAGGKYVQYQKRCFVCSAKSRYVCAGCHKTFCFTAQSAKDNSSEADDSQGRVMLDFLGGAKKNGDELVVVGQHSCYHMAHSAAIERHAARRQNEANFRTLELVSED